MMSNIPPKHPRPLSPNIQHYRPQLTSVLSIANRVTGVILSAFAVGLVIWLTAGASGPGAYAVVQRVIASWAGQIVLFACTFASFLHLCGGVRPPRVGHRAWVRTPLDIRFGMGSRCGERGANVRSLGRQRVHRRIGLWTACWSQVRHADHNASILLCAGCHRDRSHIVHRFWWLNSPAKQPRQRSVKRWRQMDSSE